MSEPRLYGELADWFHLLTAPAEYADEADLYRQVLREACDEPPRTVLELGSGGGNNASHLKKNFELTLVDRSPEMLQLSRSLNPECRHVVGDMRDVRLGEEFDAVFVHDAVSYITTEEDLAATVATAAAHLRPGGAALFVPDFVRERFEPRTDHGGHDGEHRALRYLEWCWDPNADDTTYASDFAYLLREREDVRSRARPPRLRPLPARDLARAARASGARGPAPCRAARRRAGRSRALRRAETGYRLSCRTA